MIRRLSLLRHAKSSWKDPALADHDRERLRTLPDPISTVLLIAHASDVPRLGCPRC